MQYSVHFSTWNRLVRSLEAEILESQPLRKYELALGVGQGRVAGYGFFLLSSLLVRRYSSYSLHHNPQNSAPQMKSTLNIRFASSSTGLEHLHCFTPTSTPYTFELRLHRVSPLSLSDGV